MLRLFVCGSLVPMPTADDNSKPLESRSGERGPTRRALLEPAVALALAAPVRTMAQSGARSPKKMRPQPGDRLVYAFGPREGKPIEPDAISLGAAPVDALPMSAEDGIVRDGSRLNRVVVMRLAAETLSEDTAGGAADGIVAYSAVCTHTGCDISDWRGETSRLVCPCHESEFEPADGARVMTGPAPKPLAMLPLEIAEGELRVARGFTRRVGFQRQ